MRAILAYMMAPISPSNGRTVAENIATAKAWLHFLRTITRDLRFRQRHITIAAPYIAAIEAGADEASEKDREHGLRDDCAIVERFDLVIAVGCTPDRNLTSGMNLERAACRGPLVDLMDFDGDVDVLFDDDQIEVIQRIRDAVDAVANAVQHMEDPLPPFCDGCGQEIDPETCHCGSAMEGSHEYHGHNAVPMGCRCLYDQMDWEAVARGLRERLRSERARRTG